MKAIELINHKRSEGWQVLLGVTGLQQVLGTDGRSEAGGRWNQKIFLNVWWQWSRVRMRWELVYTRRRLNWKVSRGTAHKMPGKVMKAWCPLYCWGAKKEGKPLCGRDKPQIRNVSSGKALGVDSVREGWWLKWGTGLSFLCTTKNRGLLNACMWNLEEWCR